MSSWETKAPGALALQLIHQLHRNPNTIPPYNHEVMKACSERIKQLYQANYNDLSRIQTWAVESQEQRIQIGSVLQARQTTINFVRRCGLAYLHERAKRVKELRWKFGSSIPQVIKVNLSEAEVQFHADYCKCLAEYQSTLSGEGGVDLMSLPHYPQTLFLQVRSLQDYGEFETSDGIIVVLKRNSIHSLPIGDCERLIRNGVLTPI